MHLRAFVRPLPLLISAVGVFSLWCVGSGLPAAAADRPDLDVLYVERTPRYSRYDVTAAPDGTPRLRSGTEFDQRWPNPDELVMFTAHVANYGDAASPATTYTWSIDGTIIASGTVPPLAPADERTFTYRWRWQDGTHRIRFAVDPGRQVDELTDANNVIDDRTNALSFHFHVERSFCRAFLRDTTAIGSFSCADWLQQQVAAFNTMLDAAIYDLTPTGAGVRIRIDRVTEEVDGSLSPFDVHAPDDREWDGRWGFPWAGAVRTNGNCANGWCATRSYVEKYATKTDWGLMRQLAFALGLPDRSALDVADHDVDVRSADGTRLPAAGIVPKLDGHLVYVSGCAQDPPFTDADCDERGITADPTHHVLSAYDAAALERNADFYRLPNGTSRGLPKRRGYTADFQLDLPTVNTLRVLDQAGDPLPRARVEIYQMTPAGIPDQVKYRGTTDTQGRWSLPVVTEARYGVRMDTTTPFDAAVATSAGLLRSVGPDASQDRNTLLIVVTHGAATDVHWLDVTDFNTAFWRGATGEASYTVPTTIDPVSSDRILVTSPGAGGGPNVRVFTPMGAPLVHFFAYHESFRGGVNIAVGDVDGDGKDEIVTAPGPGGSPHVRIFSNRGVFETGYFAYDASFTGGVNVAVGDVDRDGRAEIVTAPMGGGGPNIRVFGYRRGQYVPTTQNFFAYDASFTGGVNLTMADLEGDGKAEIITAPRSNGRPQLRIFGFRQGVFRPVILSLDAYDATFTGGVTLGRADRNGDGRDEILTGVEQGGGSHVRAFAWQPTTKRVQLVHPGFLVFHPDYRGGVSAVGLDTDGNGADAWVVAPRHDAEGIVRIFTHSGDRLLDEWLAYDQSFTGGVHLASGRW